MRVLSLSRPTDCMVDKLEGLFEGLSAAVEAAFPSSSAQPKPSILPRPSSAMPSLRRSHSEVGSVPGWEAVLPASKQAIPQLARSQHSASSASIVVGQRPLSTVPRKDSLSSRVPRDVAADVAKLRATHPSASDDLLGETWLETNLIVLLLFRWVTRRALPQCSEAGRVHQHRCWESKLVLAAWNRKWTSVFTETRTNVSIRTLH